MKWFSENEFKCKCCGELPEDVASNVRALVKEVLDPLREKYGKPIRVNSGYRCKHHNLEVGGAVKSCHLPDYGFSEAEKKEIVEEWNDHLGRETAAKILRKPWFEHEGTRQNPDGTEQLLGIHNRMNYQTVEHMGYLAMLSFVASFEGPEGAVWRNYTEKPSPKGSISRRDMKIDASMTNVFGSPYLTEDDWRLYP